MSDTTNEKRGERIAKLMARAGVGSRREVERMIEAGRVSLFGVRVKTPATLITTVKGLSVDGKPVAEPEPLRLWRYHKPRGLITSRTDPEGRKTIFDALPSRLPRVISIGRLDLNTEGLLLLTNDGELARWLELPSTGWVRRYRVRVYGIPDEAQLLALKEGITVDGMAYGSIDAKIEKSTASNSWLVLALQEGKNREVRRIMKHLGLAVNRLQRVSYGPFQLGPLARGDVQEVPFKTLKATLGGFMDANPSASIGRAEKQNPKKWAKAKPRPKKPGTKRTGPSRPKRGAAKPQSDR